MKYESLFVPYDMKCGECQHAASDHWASWNGFVVAAGTCYSCMREQSHCNFEHCRAFKFDNLNYIEVVAERREQEKNLI